MELGILQEEKRCRDIAHPNLWNFALSLFILIGILVSYLPQHIRIIQRRSSEGLSPWFVLLGTVSGTSAIANIILLPTSRTDVACCKVNSVFSCAAGLLGIGQVGVQWGCFFTIMLLFLIFFPRDSDRLEDRDPYSPFEHKPRWQDAVTVVALSAIHAFVTAFVSLIWFAYSSETLQVWANLLGLFSAVLACVQYLPQISTTWRLQAVMSLSIPMMCIQTPGSFVFAASLFIRLGASGWSAWGVYCVTGLLQGCLLAMAIRFELRDRRQRKADEQAAGDDVSDDHEGNGSVLVNESTQTGDDNSEPTSERTPLLGSQQSNGKTKGGDGQSQNKGHETIKKSKLSIVHNADNSTP